MYRLWGRYSEAGTAETSHRVGGAPRLRIAPTALRYLENLAGLYAQQGRVAESKSGSNAPPMAEEDGVQHQRRRRGRRPRGGGPGRDEEESGAARVGEPVQIKIKIKVAKTATKTRVAPSKSPTKKRAVVAGSAPRRKRRERRGPPLGRVGGDEAPGRAAGRRTNVDDDAHLRTKHAAGTGTQPRARAMARASGRRRRRGRGRGAGRGGGAGREAAGGGNEDAKETDARPR